MSTLISPPECMKADDYAAAEPARQRLVAKRRFRLFASLPAIGKFGSAVDPKHKGKGKAQDPDENDEQGLVQIQSSLPPVDRATLIALENPVVDEGEHKPAYRWAILYENQRGTTIFSIPHYSSLSLLPTDPPPFTLPCLTDRLSSKANVSPASYPLPDGRWLWVSNDWMIDMRSDSGEVQHDGFEYNWRFRKDKWHAEVGPFGAGGWVRRRRWVRLMMRPPKVMHVESEPHHGFSASSLSGGSSHASRIDIPSPREGSSTHSVPLSERPRTTNAEDTFASEADDVWRGDDSEQDWARCHALMRRVGRDGRKLELWKRWLEPHIAKRETAPNNKGKGKLRDNDSIPPQIAIDPPPPALEYIIPTLRKHADALLHLFIFPESRAQFISLLGRAGLLPNLNVQFGTGWSATELDFYSYAGELVSEG